MAVRSLFLKYIIDDDKLCNIKMKRRQNYYLTKNMFLLYKVRNLRLIQVLKNIFKYKLILILIILLIQIKVKI